MRSSGYYSASTFLTSKQSQERKEIAQSQRNSLTSVTSISSEESVHLKLNPAEEDNSLQLEDEGKTKLAHPNKIRPKGPSGRIPPSKHYKKTEEGPHCVISVTGSKVKDTIQYNTIQYNTIQYNTIQYNTIQYNTIQYNTIQYNNYEKNSKIKNKNLHVALVTSSALLAIG
ncbi:hypothetical protein JSQ73_003430 [Wolbachia endosymbiont of Anopheles demeilloni]|nr:hypothetical protein [Wolbachia endosymbiont of Anopheles demeilloni]UIP92242.1 hypothetical protein JSQ73_003430 [Wolbachia endosymbiont of Anopheles demeilloni]